MTFAPTTYVRLGRDIASSEMFLQELNHEHKRAERSGRPFVLVLISGDCFQAEGRANLAPSIATAVASCKRETDSIGWYEQNLTLGVMLTELGQVNSSKVELLVQKISSVIKQSISPQDFCGIQIAIRILPHSSGDSIQADNTRESIYRDLYQRPVGKHRSDMLKRAVDIVGSCVLLLLLIPVFIAIALLVKTTSNGPVFFCHKRVGQYGKLFNFYKFRSMRVNSDYTIHRNYVTELINGTLQTRQPNGLYKLSADTRITPLGRILRRTSLDELPQFANVLLGEMSLVGPRPPLPYEFDCYRAWHKRRVMEIKPGLTGLWQVHGRSRTTFDEMVRMDLRYARTQSLWLDMKILLQTPAAMFLGRGAR
jgi:lipopolysaccharide/colanic/teichoic acid biosynthesis glycosyltransferase